MHVFRVNILTRFLLISAGFILAALCFCFFVQILPLQQKYARNLMLDKGMTLLKISERGLAIALGSRDDVALLNHINGMMKTDDVSTVFILGPDGKVLMHDKTSEWGAMYHDVFSRNALAAHGVLLQRAAAAPGYLFSAPLTSSATLCIGLAAEKVNAAMLYERRNSAYSLLILFLLAAVLLVLFFRIRIFKRVNALKAMLASADTALSDDFVTGRDEFSDLAAGVRRLVERLSERHRGAMSGIEQTGAALTAVVRALGAVSDRGVIALDAENRYIHVNARACAFLKLEEADITGRHVLDVVPNRETMARLLKDAAVTPAVFVSADIDGKTVRVMQVRDGMNRPAGTILLTD
jgi:PAS domain-containing protein